MHDFHPFLRDMPVFPFYKHMVVFIFPVNLPSTDMNSSFQLSLFHILMRLHPLQQLFNRRIRVALTPCDLKIKFFRAAVRAEKRNHYQIPRIPIMADGVFRKESPHQIPLTPPEAPSVPPVHAPRYSV